MPKRTHLLAGSLLAALAAPEAAAQGTLFPVSHAQTEGLADYAHVGTTGSVANLRDQDGRNLNSGWLESGFPVELHETFTFEHATRPADTILEFRIVALLYMDGIDSFPLATPIPPPPRIDGSEERYLYAARFEVQDVGGTWQPATHRVGGRARGANVFDPAYPHTPPNQGTLRWDNGPSQPQWPENHLWSLPLGSGHPGEIVATGYMSRDGFQSTGNGFAVQVRFFKSAQVATGFHSITHRWDDLAIAFRPAGSQSAFQPFGTLVAHRVDEVVDPRLRTSEPPPGSPPPSRFGRVVAEGDVVEARTRDGRCIAGRWLDSQPSPGQRALRIADEFEFDALPFGLTSGAQLDSLAFRAIFYKHGDHGLAPNRAGDPPFSFSDPSEEETIALARVEILDWTSGDFTPLTTTWFPLAGYVPGSGAPWRNAGPGSYPELLSRPGTYPGGIDLRARAAEGFPFAPGHVSSAGRIRLRLFEQYTQDDMDGGWDVTHSFDSVQLHATFGRGCAPVGRPLADLFTTDRTLVGDPLRLRVHGAPVQAPLAYLMANARLVPAIDLGAFGFANCLVHVPNDLTLAATSDANGEHVLDLGVLPGQSFLLGRPIWVQAFGIAPGSTLFATNALGFWIQ